MGLSELLLLALGLSMDAFAAALCRGLAIGKPQWRQAAVPGLWFGAFQGLMPLLGWLLGTRFAFCAAALDHWIAFGLLTVLGINMLRETGEEDGDGSASLAWRPMLALALATSIDALAVGVTFAFLAVPVLPAAGTIAAVTFLVSALGVRLGGRFGARLEGRARMLGGGLLILLGGRILLEHTGHWPF